MILTYNGIRLPYAQVNRFDKVAQADPSNTDRTLMRYDIEVLVTLTHDYMAAVLGSEEDADAMPYFDSGACQVRIYELLMRRRKALSVVINGFDMIPSFEGAPPIDAANGPVPQYCRITRLDSKTCMMLYGIVAHYYEILDAETLGNQGSPSPVIYNRWRETVEIDDCDGVTRTREGALRIRSDNAQTVTPDMLRAECACLSIPDKFLRTGRTYSLSEDGLGLKYRVTDAEQHKMPPAPAFRADGHYRETALGAGGANRFAQCHTRLWGSNQVSQARLMDTAIAVCVSKMRLIGAPLSGDLQQGQGRGILVQAVFECNHYRNVVDVVLVAKIPVDETRVLGIAGLTKAMTGVPLSDGVSDPATNRPPYRAYGTGSILLQAACYFDPEAGNAALVGGQQKTLANPNVTYDNVQVNTQGSQPGTGDVALT